MLLQWLTLLKSHNVSKVCVCQGILGTGVCSVTNSKRGLVFQSASESNLKRDRVTRGVKGHGRSANERLHSDKCESTTCAFLKKV